MDGLEKEDFLRFAREKTRGREEMYFALVGERKNRNSKKEGREISLWKERKRGGETMIKESSSAFFLYHRRGGGRRKRKKEMSIISHRREEKGGVNREKPDS